MAEVGASARAVHFPLTGVFSAIVPLLDGSSVEAATVGNEGMTGFDLLTAPAAGVYRVILQIEGERLRLPAAEFETLLSGGGLLRPLVERYVMTVLRQSGQTAACNLRHTLEERTCRWLLMTHDRVGSDLFCLTQEFLGIMLGARRQSVALAAAALQTAGLISYRRGGIRILDRAGLERAACECYEAVKQSYGRVMRP
ncbi:MAG TPA: Crp/Fnr family transcriptional regulator, partial [Planctomycetaceae bacterium]